MGPVRRLLKRPNMVRVKQLSMANVRFKVGDNAKTLGGIVSESKLEETLRCWSVRHWPIPSGRLPKRLLLERSSHRSAPQ